MMTWEWLEMAGALAVLAGWFAYRRMRDGWAVQGNRPLQVQAAVLRAGLAACPDRWPEIAKRADVSLSWIRQFTRGDITNPTINTLESVVSALPQTAPRRSMTPKLASFYPLRSIATS